MERGRCMVNTKSTYLYRVVRCLLILCLSVSPGLIATATEFKLFEEKGKVGLKNDQGAVVLPPAFEALGWSDGSFSVIGQITGYKLNGGWGLINLKKEYITKAEFESLIFCGADRVVAIKKVNDIFYKTGSLTLTGKVTIPFEYDAISVHGLRAVVMIKSGIDYRFGLTDLENRVILPLKFNNIYPVGTLRFAVENKGKLALFSDEGKQVTDFFIDSISPFHRSHAVIHSEGWQGVMDRDGNVVVSPKYRNIQFRDDETVRALLPGNWKIVDNKNLEVQSLQADELHAYANDHYRVIRTGKQGIIDKSLKEIWPLTYDHIGGIKNGLIPAKKNNKWGLLTIDQAEALPFSFDSLLWDGEFALARTNEVGKNLWTLYNVKAKLKSKGYDAIERLNADFFKVRKGGYSGLLNRQGKETVHCVYDSILELKDNQVAVSFMKQFGIISTNEDWILPPQPFPLQLVNERLYLEQQAKTTFLKSLVGDIIYFTDNPLEVKVDHLLEYLPRGYSKKVGFNGLEMKRTKPLATQANNIEPQREILFHDGLQIFQSQGKFGFHDERGRLAIPNRYDSVKSFSDQMAAFKLLGKWGYLNAEDKIIVNPSYDFAGDFDRGFAIVSKNKKFGLIDKTGALRLSLHYDSILKKADKLFLFLSGKTGLATLEGKILVEARYNYLRDLPNSQLLVGLDKKFGIISSDGLSIVPIIYSSLEYDEAKNLYLAHQEAEWTTLRFER